MKTPRFIFFGTGALIGIGLFLCGQGPVQSADSDTVAMASSRQFQAEFSRRAKKPEPVVSFESEPLPTESNLALRAIVGTDAASVNERYKAVHALSRKLSSGEIAVLYVFLKSLPSPREDNLPALRLLKNDILDVLIEQVSPPSGLTDTMIEIYRDSRQDSVSRDYAIQHLVTWYEFGASDAPDAKARIQATLRQAAQEPSSIAGTALLGWDRLSRNDATFNPEEIDACALQLAQSADTDTATRITTIQVCAERNLKVALPAIESVAAAPGCLPLRLSAMAAMKHLGSQQPVMTEQLFVNFKQESEQNAVRVALEQPQRTEDDD